MAAVVELVDRLEVALESFVRNVGIEFNKVYNAQVRMEQEFKEFKGEMRTFRDKVGQDIEESRRERREMNRKWGDLANRLGTLVEISLNPQALG